MTFPSLFNPPLSPILRTNHKLATLSTAKKVFSSLPSTGQHDSNQISKPTRVVGVPPRPSPRRSGSSNNRLSNTLGKLARKLEEEREWLQLATSNRKDRWTDGGGQRTARRETHPANSEDGRGQRAAAGYPSGFKIIWSRRLGMHSHRTEIRGRAIFGTMDWWGDLNTGRYKPGLAGRDRERDIWKVWVNFTAHVTLLYSMTSAVSWIVLSFEYVNHEQITLSELQYYLTTHFSS